jgi:UDP-glucose 4-epimerase
MKVLITGGSGYLGGRLAQFLVSQSGFDVILGSRQLGAPPPWLPKATVVKTHWKAADELAQICFGVDSIVHAAGMSASDCIADPVGALEFNGSTTARLLDAAITQGVKRFVYVSTAHVYASVLNGHITESTCPVSLHPYATSHRAGEDVVRGAHERGEIEGIVMRLSNAYGAPAHPDANCWMLLVNDLCRQGLNSNRMVIRSSGKQHRDFISLTDACRAIEKLLKLPAGELRDGLFNAGGAWAPTILEMASRIAERIGAATGVRPEIVCKHGDSADDSQSLVYNIERLMSTGFNTSGEQIIDREIDGLIRFCLEHQN